MSSELVFVHGWGFEARFWDALAALLPGFRHSRVDRGFFGTPHDLKPAKGPHILVGHSLGFVHGIAMKQDWSGWIAINGFVRFVQDKGHAGCVPETSLRDMKKHLQANPTATLRNFYRQIDARPKSGAPDAVRLAAGLDELRDADVNKTLTAFTALNVPGLVLAARNDPLVPVPASEALGRFVAPDNFLWHDSGGHMLPATAAAWCAAAIANFLEHLPA